MKIMKFTEYYNEIKQAYPAGLRDHLRNIALNGLSVVDTIRGINEWLNKPRIQFLYVHHVFRDEEEKLEVLLKKLAMNHTFISYGEAIAKMINREIDRPYICISSDDGFKNNIRLAEILNRYSAKACFFVSPAIVGETDFNKIKNYCNTKLRFLPVEFLNWKDIEILQKSGHEIGSHTMEHINVAETPEEIFVEDCHKTFEIIKSNCGRAEHFAFPYGRFFHFNEMGRRVVFDAGFISCATAERGCHINHNEQISYERLCILRDHVILDWDIKHTLHFIAQNSRNASPENNLFPYTNF